MIWLSGLLNQREPWIWISRTASPVRGYDVFPDGSFVFPVWDDDGRTLIERIGATQLHVILNWTEELKVRVPN